MIDLKTHFANLTALRVVHSAAYVPNRLIHLSAACRAVGESLHLLIS